MMMMEMVDREKTTFEEDGSDLMPGSSHGELIRELDR
jgi:hypothetical protein